MTQKDINERLPASEELFRQPALGARKIFIPRASGSTIGSLVPDIMPSEVMVDKGFPGYRANMSGGGHFRVEEIAKKLLEPSIRARVATELQTTKFMDKALEALLPTNDSKLKRGVKVFPSDTLLTVIKQKVGLTGPEAEVLADLTCHIVSEFGVIAPSYERVTIEPRYKDIHPNLEAIQQDVHLRNLMDILDSAKASLALKPEREIYYKAIRGLLLHPLNSLGRALRKSLSDVDFRFQTALILVHRRVTNNDEFFSLNSSVRDDASLEGLCSNLTFVRAAFELVNRAPEAEPALPPGEWKDAMKSIYLAIKQSPRYDCVSLVEHAKRYSTKVIKDSEGVRKLGFIAKNLAAENRNQVTHFFPTGEREDSFFQEPNHALETKLDAALSGLAPRLNTAANLEVLSAIGSHLVHGIKEPTMIVLNMDDNELEAVAAARSSQVLYGWGGGELDGEFSLVYECDVEGPVNAFDENVINGRLVTRNAMELLLYSGDSVDGPNFPPRVQSIPEEDRRHALQTPYKQLAIKFDRPIDVLMEGTDPKQIYSIKLDMAELFGTPVWNAGVTDLQLPGSEAAKAAADACPGLNPYVTVNPINLALVNSFIQGLNHMSALSASSTDPDVKELKYIVDAQIATSVVSLLQTIYDTPMGDMMERAIHRRLIMQQPDLPSKLKVKSGLKMNKMFEMGRVNLALALLVRVGAMSHEDMQHSIRAITTGRLWGTIGRTRSN